MEWQEAHDIFPVSQTDWTNSAYLTGNARAHVTVKKQISFAELKNFGRRNLWKTHNRFYHADDVTVSYGYLDMNERDKNDVDLETTKTFVQKYLYEPNK
ncbi:glycoside hydrolase family 88 protein [Maribacter antarcticus]|uniref:hypothetical protein n=1 Tax=Maribacter antarcticus TaxID=505250 RepID=UPI0004791DE0|nr:hypothetical protein [Maribacter antarcticus]